MAEKIAIISEKGGVGKTATTINLGYELAAAGKKVLLIDMDPLGSMTCGFKLKTRECTIAELLRCTIDKTPMPSKDTYMVHVNGVDIIPCSEELVVIAQDINITPKFEQILKRTIAGLIGGYDYVLFDCASKLDFFNVMVLNASDSIIIPTTADTFSVDSLRRLMGAINNVKRFYNQELQILGFLVTLFEKRTTLNNDFDDLIQKEFGPFFRVFESRIPRSVTVNESLGQGYSIGNYQKRNPAAIAYKNFAKEVLDLGKH